MSHIKYATDSVVLSVILVEHKNLHEGKWCFNMHILSFIFVSMIEG